MRSPFLLLFALPGCSAQTSGPFLGFEEVASVWGIAAEEANGACVFDIDSDGDNDLLLTTEHAAPRLYVQAGPGDFIEDGAARGLDIEPQSQGCGYADVDRDLDPDLVLTFRDARSRYFRNDGTGHFTDATDEAGLGNTWNQKSVVWEDVDKDGWVDLFLPAIQGGSTRIFRNEDGHFVDRTPGTPLADVRHCWVGSFFDSDNDGRSELFVASDFWDEVDRFLHNDGDFQWTDITEAATIQDTTHSMGIAVADVDTDGWLDFYITNFGPNVLWRNARDGSFYDVGQSWDVATSGRASGWGTFFFDADHDADLDLFAANGATFLYDNGSNPVFPATERDAFFLQSTAPGEDPLFVEVGAATGIDDDGSSFGASWGDVDGDGWLDVVVANRFGDRSRVFRNLGIEEPAGAAPLRVLLRGTSSNTDALGARVVAQACGRRVAALRNPGTSVVSHGEPALHFAFDGCGEDIELELRWPSGLEERRTLPAPQWGDATVLIIEGEGDS